MVLGQSPLDPGGKTIFILVSSTAFNVGSVHLQEYMKLLVSVLPGETLPSSWGVMVHALQQDFH
jgi:hypothetical protein